MVFHLVINSGSCARYRHLFIPSASLSWMEVKPYIPSSLDVFQIDILLVSFWGNLCVLPLSGFLRGLLILWSFCLRVTLYCFKWIFEIMQCVLVSNYFENPCLTVYNWKQKLLYWLCHKTSKQGFTCLKTDKSTAYIHSSVLFFVCLFVWFVGFLVVLVPFISRI